MNLCVPMLQVILHAIVDYLREEDFTQEGKWWRKAAFWSNLARLGMPVAYVMTGLVIVLPGFIRSKISTA